MSFETWVGCVLMRCPEEAVTDRPFLRLITPRYVLRWTSYSKEELLVLLDAINVIEMDTTQQLGHWKTFWHVLYDNETIRAQLPLLLRVINPPGSLRQWCIEAHVHLRSIPLYADFLLMACTPGSRCTGIVRPIVYDLILCHRHMATPWGVTPDGGLAENERQLDRDREIPRRDQPWPKWAHRAGDDCSVLCCLLILRGIPTFGEYDRRIWAVWQRFQQDVNSRVLDMRGSEPQQPTYLSTADVHSHYNLLITTCASRQLRLEREGPWWHKLPRLFLGYN